MTDLLTTHTTTRRGFVAAGAMSAAAAAFLANGGNPLAAQGTPASTPDPRPDVGTEGLQRGDAGELRILWWQAPTNLNPHVLGDTGGEFVLEPLMSYFKEETIQPILLESVPTVENGQLSADLKTATLKLRPGLLWSDGEPLTANDIVFTWKWVVEPSNATFTFEQWNMIENIEAVDDLTADVTFKEGVVNWFDPFTGYTAGVVLPAHAFNNDPTNANEAFQTHPIGSGPYKVEDFAPNDQGSYVINENYREPNKPYFSRIVVKGGGDPVAGGRSVMEVGDYDFAWNVQAEPEVIQQLEQGGKGVIIVDIGPTLESLYFNFSDPNTEVDGQRSEMNTPHPFLSDPAVRKAIGMAIDRELIAEQFYGDKSYVTANQLTGLDFFNSPNTSWSFDPDAANKVLEDAGWVMDGDVRAKDGVRLEMGLASSVNGVRQKTQAVIKQNLATIGINVQIITVDASVYFDSSAGNEQGVQHFYWDAALWSSGTATKIPVQWMAFWYAGPDGSNIAQKSNDWQKNNVQRYRSEEYDKLYEQLLAVKTEDEAQKTLIAMNDLLIADNAMVPLVDRPFFSAVSKRLRLENIDFSNPFAGYFWNIVNWNLADGVEPR